MKKVIALLLALMMIFSVATVAFATEDSAPATEEKTAEELLGDYAWILDIPAGTIGPALKFAMFALKAAKVYVKICGVFNLDPIDTAGKIVEFVEKALADAQVEKPETAPAA